MSYRPRSSSAGIATVAVLGLLTSMICTPAIAQSELEMDRDIIYWLSPAFGGTR